ncbi:MAG TPA: 3-isopropylmalate dehydratase small subunit [Methylomirabilota bacterium]|nr:3-isopropylmalate dehydratase small subunit [Methylomirabilota bacterium]
MEPFVRLTAVAAPMDLPNIDTDRIIPARFLRRPRESGFGPLLFHDVRFDASGTERPEFVLNRPAYRPARILVTAENFGCGSSREMAVWALLDHGIRVLIGPSFGDIFFENCFKNGALPIVVPAATAAALRQTLAARPGTALTVDLEAQTITGPDGAAIHFEVDGFRKHGLLTGRDELALTLEQMPAIEAFEARRRAEMPWLG